MLPPVLLEEKEAMLSEEEVVLPEVVWQQCHTEEMGFYVCDRNIPVVM